MKKVFDLLPILEQRAKLEGTLLADYAYVISKGVIVLESMSEDLERNEEIKGTYLGVTG